MKEHIFNLLQTHPHGLVFVTECRINPTDSRNFGFNFFNCCGWVCGSLVAVRDHVKTTLLVLRLR